MITENVYSEVYEILSYMDKMSVMKIPMEILNTIKENRNKKYISKINKKDIFNRNNVLPETIKYMAWIDVNFWETKEEKERLKKLHIKKIAQEEKEKSEKYRKIEYFKKENVSKTNYDTISADINKTEIIEYKEPLLKKLINKIKKLLHIKR